MNKILCSSCEDEFETNTRLSEGEDDVRIEEPTKTICEDCRGGSGEIEGEDVVEE